MSMPELDSVTHLLPDSVKEMIDLIGMPKTLILIDRLGGTTWPFSKNTSKLGRLRYDVIAELVGVEAADKLTQRFGGDVFAIPKCEFAVRELRNRNLRNQFDALVSQGLGSNQAVSILAKQFALTDRHVWRILGRADSDLNYPLTFS